LQEKTLRRFFAFVSAILAVTVFFVAANQHAMREYGIGVLAIWQSKPHVLEVFLFLSPCIIFVITTSAYYRYIVDYTGVIAGWSFVGFLGAMICCEQLLEAAPADWAAHIFWVYVLFLTYAWWDAAMLLWFLPGAKDRVLAKADDEEIYAITSMVNWPTLGGLLLIWWFAHHLASEGLDTVVSCYVNGVVAFHLVYASVLAFLNLRLIPQRRDRETATD
jgi:hypothetical protein